MAPFTATFLVFVALFLQSVISQTSLNYCEALADALSICQEETPSFTVLPQTAQAECLCGSQLGTIPWGPATFDGLAASCAVQYATIDATIAYDASELAGFCTSVAAQSSNGISPQTSNAPQITVSLCHAPHEYCSF
jgi:hypothetical protein